MSRGRRGQRDGGALSLESDGRDEGPGAAARPAISMHFMRRRNSAGSEALRDTRVLPSGARSLDLCGRRAAQRVGTTYANGDPLFLR